MAIESIFVFASAAIILMLGMAHLSFTFWGPKLRPRKEQTIEAMRTSTLVLTKETTVWRAWLGFNASHSMSALLFGATYGYLAVARPDTLFDSLYFQTVGIVFLTIYVVLAHRFWFRTPLIGIAAAFLCFVAGVWVSIESPDPPQTAATAEVTTAETTAVEGTVAEATSLLGQPLTGPQLGDEFRQQQRALLAAAQEQLAAEPEDLEAWIWLGRRQAYLGQYRDAIATYGRAIEALGPNPRLLRHRGHRWITTRQLDHAIADLSQAAQLFAGQPDRIEADGLPNARNIPTSTLGTNIWYHLGLAHYLKGDFASALTAYRECLKLSKNPDMLVATSHWLYMTLKRLGRDAEAARVLEPISPELEIIENGDYHHLLMLYRGDKQAEALLETARKTGAPALATVGYGVGTWHYYNGRQAAARSIWQEILATDAWASFGFIAAEAELARLASADREK